MNKNDIVKNIAEKIREENAKIEVIAPEKVDRNKVVDFSSMLVDKKFAKVHSEAVRDL